jgi:hypothetical protein
VGSHLSASCRHALPFPSAGGFEVLRAAEAIVAANGGAVPVESAHVTTAGQLPFKARNASRLTPERTIRACVKNALAAATILASLQWRCR